MFGRKHRRQGPIETLVGGATRVNGDLHFEGGCHIDGVVHGSVIADGDEESTLSVSDNGEIHGGVDVPHVILNGMVRGDVTARARVELGPTARVIGNVYYNLIEMAIGAEINGKLVHKADAPASAGEPQVAAVARESA